MNTRRNWIVIGLVVLVAAFFLARYMLRPSVVVAESTRGTATLNITGTVTVIPVAESLIISPYGGRIVSSKLNVGAEFPAGFVVASVNPEQVAFQLKQAEGDLAVLIKAVEDGLPAQTEAAGLERELAQAEALLREGAMAPMEVERVRTKRDISLANIRKQRAETDAALSRLRVTVEDLRERLEKHNLKMPFDGAIVSVLAHTGDQIGENTVVAKVVSREYFVKAEVNQDAVGAIRHGSRAHVRLFAFGDQLFTGVVERLLPVSDPISQRYGLYLKLENAPERLQSGLTGEVTIQAGHRENAVLVPRRALVGDKLYVVKDGALEVRSVRVGYLSLTKAEILEGLAPGERVVIEGQEHLRRGESVRIGRIAPFQP